MNLSIPMKLKASPWLAHDAAPPEKQAAPTPAAPMPAEPAPARSAPASRSLPLIGRWPVARQFKALLGVLLVFLVLATAFVFVDNRQAAQTAAAVSTATEMQMLSQRVANTAQRAAGGSPIAFGQLLRARNRFTNDLELLTHGGRRLGQRVDPAPSALQPRLHALSTLWSSLQAPINHILSQRGHLLDLKQEESTIEKAVPQLALLAQGLVVAAIDAQEGPRTLTYIRQLAADVSNYDFADTLRLLSTDDPHDQVALQLAVNVREFDQKLNALLGLARDNITRPIADPAVKRQAERLSKVFEPFSSSVQLIVSNMHALALAKQSSRDVFRASEALLKGPVALVDAYQNNARTQIYYVIGAIVCALLALATLILLGKVFLDDARRRAISSEEENRRNQDAILRLLDEMAQVADGDLTVEARVTEDVTGAIADSVNYTIEELRRLVSGITRAAAQVSAATVEAQRITGQLLDASQSQTARIQSTGQSVAKMVKSIGEVSENASRSAEVAQQSLVAAEHGAAAVQRAVRGMNDIREQIQETSKRIKRLGESSQEIGEIVQLITEITEQTNVLALNAAIQAASAGEAGRGFTVVAEEVQRLAERSAEATKHISLIVKTIQRDTHDTAEAMEQSTQGVVDGTRIADEAGQALREIEDVSKRLASLIASISNATQAQAQSAVEIEGNMQGILRITELTSAGTKKTTASASQLNALANDLKSSVTRFKLA